MRCPSIEVPSSVATRYAIGRSPRLHFMALSPHLTESLLDDSSAMSHATTSVRRPQPSEGRVQREGRQARA